MKINHLRVKFNEFQNSTQIPKLTRADFWVLSEFTQIGIEGSEDQLLKTVTFNESEDSEQQTKVLKL